MIKIAEFKPEHMMNMNLDTKDLDADVLTFMGDIDSRAIQYAVSGPAITLFDDDDGGGKVVLAVGGCIYFWHGVGEVWMMVSPEGRLKRIALYKTMNIFVQDCFDKYGFHRVQTSILTGHKEAHKCIMRMGFIPEGMMVHYGPRKENYIRYVKLAEA